MPTLTYRCCNTKCGREYDSSAASPKCPTCKSVRRQWLPQRISIRKVSPQIDRDVRQAADNYGVTNFQRPYYGEPMIMRRSGSPPDGATMSDPVGVGGEGWGARLWQDPSGKPLMKSTCEPAGKIARVRPQMGTAVSERGPSVLGATVFEGKTSQRTVPGL